MDSNKFLEEVANAVSYYDYDKFTKLLKKNPKKINETLYDTSIFDTVHDTIEEPEIRLKFINFLMKKGYKLRPYEKKQLDELKGSSPVHRVRSVTKSPVAPRVRSKTPSHVTKNTNSQSVQYKGQSYAVRVGNCGGRYILVQGKKKYIKQ